MCFQIAVTSENVAKLAWSILVEFRSASSEIRRRKKERRRKNPW